MAIATTDKGLVTVFGGSGFVGRHLVRALVKRGWRVRALHRNPEKAAAASSLQVQWLKGDAMNQGDVVVIYSDGVTDARSRSDELYDSASNHRLLKRVAQSSGGPAAVGRSILQEIREFSADHAQADDITLVCLGPTSG